MKWWIQLKIWWNGETKHIIQKGFLNLRGLLEKAKDIFETEEDHLPQTVMIFGSVSRSLLHLFILLAITASNKRSKQKTISTWATINRDFLWSETKDGAQTYKRFFWNDPGNPRPPRGSSNQWKSILSILHWGFVVQTPVKSHLTLTYWRFCVGLRLIAVLKPRDGFKMKAECEESKVARCLTRFTVLEGQAV